MKFIALSVVAGLLLVGCKYNGLSPSSATKQQQVVVQKVDRDDILRVIKEEGMAQSSMPDDVTLIASGEGIAPLNAVSIAQAKVLAKRAAMASAYANLAGKLYGVKISGEDTIKDAMLQNSRINARVQGLVKNASIIDEGFVDGLYKVTLELKINQERWKEVFAY